MVRSGSVASASGPDGLSRAELGRGRSVNSVSSGVLSLKVVVILILNLKDGKDGPDGEVGVGGTRAGE